MGLFGGKMLLGYDLGNEFCQISYAPSVIGEVETLSQVAGGQNYHIPTALCKRIGSGQWFYGREAVRCAGEGQGILIQNLLGQALDGEMVVIEGESYDPVALLTLFVKRSLALLGQVASSDKIGGMLITVEYLDGRTLEVLNQVAAGLRLKTEKITFQSHMESYYSFMLRQPWALWNNRSMLFAYRDSHILVYELECNLRTTPVVVYIQERAFPFFLWEPLPEEEGVRNARIQELDRGLLKVAQEVFGEKQVDSVYLIGDGFDQMWMKDSLRFLCRGRKVFQGSNLFSKGACIGLQERIVPSEAGKGHVFLGNDKLKANVGMKILRQGEESYYAILDAGVNWYEAQAEMEFYIQDGDGFQVTVTPLIGRSGKQAQILLEDMPGPIARIHARFYLEEETALTVEARDLGFGEFRPASGHVWKEKIPLF